MKKTPVVTQNDLDKMTITEISALKSEQIPDGYCMEIRGTKAVLVLEAGDDEDDEMDAALLEDAPISEETLKTMDSSAESLKEGKAGTPVDFQELKPFIEEEIIPPAKPSTDSFNSNRDRPTKGILFLKDFTRDEAKNKLLTRLQGKVYFPKDKNIKEGWHVATVIESHDRYGIMETTELSSIPIALWEARMIKGVFVERCQKERLLKIYPAIPKDKLDRGHIPVLIHSIPLPEEEQSEPSHYESIGNLVSQFERDAIEKLKNRSNY